MKTLVATGRYIDGISELTISPDWYRLTAAQRETLERALENAAFWSEYQEFVDASDFNELDESTSRHVDTVAWIANGGNDENQNY